MSDACRVLLIDDHAIVRAGCRRLLEPAGHYHLTEAVSGADGLAQYAAVKPDIIILDLSLPDMSGLDVLNRLRGEGCKIPVLVFTMHDEPVYALRALQAGAQGYLTKGAPPGELLTAIDALAAGKPYLSHDMAQEVALMGAARRDDPVESLTRRELDILGLLAKGRTLSEIAEALGLSYKTVANASVRLRARLGAKSTSELVRIGMEHGLVN